MKLNITIDQVPCHMELTCCCVSRGAVPSRCSGRTRAPGRTTAWLGCRQEPGPWGIVFSALHGVWKTGSLQVPKKRKWHFPLVQCQSLKLKPIKCLGAKSEKLTITHIEMWLTGVSGQRLIPHQACEAACPLFQKNKSPWIASKPHFQCSDHFTSISAAGIKVSPRFHLFVFR